MPSEMWSSYSKGVFLNPKSGSIIKGFTKIFILPFEIIYCGISKLVTSLWPFGPLSLSQFSNLSVLCSHTLLFFCLVSQYDKISLLCFCTT